jgi:hypothetical protein
VAEWASSEIDDPTNKLVPDIAEGYFVFYFVIIGDNQVLRGLQVAFADVCWADGARFSAARDEKLSWNDSIAVAFALCQRLHDEETLKQLKILADILD